MSNGTFRFEIGKLECVSVSDGSFTYTPPTFPPPAILLFANAPRERLEQVLLENVQLIIKPALNPDEDVIAVFGLPGRLTF